MFQPVVLFDFDEQWVADLVEVQNIAKKNKGFRYIPVVIDAFSKYAWAQPIEKKTGKDVSDALPRYSYQLTDVNLKHYRQMKERNFAINSFKIC